MKLGLFYSVTENKNKCILYSSDQAEVTITQKIPSWPEYIITWDPLWSKFHNLTIGKYVLWLIVLYR